MILKTHQLHCRYEFFYSEHFNIFSVCLLRVNKVTCWIQIKTNVDTQGDFIRNLAREVQTAAYDEIEDMIAFVSWLDEELSFLVRLFLFQSYNLDQGI